MAKIIEGLYYSESEEWVRVEGNTVTIGVTDHAQDQLGDIVFLELPPVGETFSRGDVFGVIESVKTLSDLVAPVSGEIVEVNEGAVQAPETVNQDPYGDAWLVKVRVSDLEADLEALMDAAGYKSHVDA